MVNRFMVRCMVFQSRSKAFEGKYSGIPGFLFEDVHRCYNQLS